MRPCRAASARWSACVPVWLLSNHRTHWLLPAFEAVRRPGVLRTNPRLRHELARQTEQRAFEVLLGQDCHPKRILFVDDQADHVEARTSIGHQRSTCARRRQVGRFGVQFARRVTCSHRRFGQEARLLNCRYRLECLRSALDAPHPV